MTVWDLPGFFYDARRKAARLEVIVPKTGAAKRRRKTVHGVTRDEALNAWKEFRLEVLQGRKSPSKMTLLNYRQTEWPKVIRGLARKTARHETWILDKVLLPALGLLELAAINDAVVRDFVADLSVTGYAPASVNGVVAVLRKILRDALDRGILSVLPVRKFPRQKEPVLRLELTDEERTRFIAAFDDEKGFMKALEQSKQPRRAVASSFFRTPRRFGGGRRIGGEAAEYDFKRFQASKRFFIIALETGLTRQDLLALGWSSVDLRGGWIRVARAKTGIEAEIPISKACRAALAECKRQPLVGEKVFLNETGCPFSVSTVVRYFQRAKKIAGITRRLRLHDLRHTYASRLASRGVSIQLIGKALGHKTISMVQRYARPSAEALRVITAALDSDSANGGRSSDSTLPR